ncbi:related to GCD2 - translation initiation factor eIF2B, 71 kDa (delta) subunit [Melanopsichium pennsylvanicum]|uniref:Translation initiation factor eIF2B subunit delta n=2 Tax=Melanopsichium pennsylvanicum TaxID=63383 RepID=A0AAJ5C5B8_9BASI|nr:related to GCD2-translation initiation factor eIF2B, 71 kDa (delta) subunit [Melanopsichium pennsylvanicum 4]SNX84572.1 related to GCD2 - translation initiation factor eIF2B, 71 kDa (delta) subunit [Melanopsichium pennsylvanicum]
MSDHTPIAASSAVSASSTSSSSVGPTTDPTKKAAQPNPNNKVSSDKKMSAKELKAARRAAKVAERGLDHTSLPVRVPPSSNAQPSATQQQASTKQQQRPRSSSNNAPSSRPSTSAGLLHNAPPTSMVATASTSGTRKAVHDVEAATKSIPPHPSVALFGNVSSNKPHNTHINAQVSASFRSNIHPSVLKLSTQLAQYKLIGADTRAIALLRAMADVIRDYKTPHGEMLNRDLLKNVSAQVGHLVDARAMGTSQGVAVRYLKYEISVVSADLTEDEAKEHLLERIDHFVRDRIVYASRIICTQAGSKIKHGDVVMTFARSSVVEGTLLSAWQLGIRFQVIVVDTRPLLEGKALLSVLLAAGIPCTYGLISSLSSLMPRAHILLLGTSALLANGALYSRSGTATCAMMAKEKGIPVIVCCETYKFSERVQLDSFVQNEAGNPRDLLLPTKDQVDAADQEETQNANKGLIDVAEWEASNHLAVVNLLYDVTPPRFISAVASEVGLSGPESVGVILRDYKSVLYGV